MYGLGRTIFTWAFWKCSSYAICSNIVQASFKDTAFTKERAKSNGQSALELKSSNKSIYNQLFLHLTICKHQQSSIHRQTLNNSATRKQATNPQHNAYATQASGSQNSLATCVNHSFSLLAASLDFIDTSVQYIGLFP